MNEGTGWLFIMADEWEPMQVQPSSEHPLMRTGSVSKGAKRAAVY